MPRPTPDPKPDPGLASALFTPRSVALIGLSSNPRTPAGRPLGFLRREGFAGAVHIVNPARDRVQGEPALPSLADVEGPVDHAYILVGQARVEQAVADCVAAGVRVATILADGYAESGPDGQARQDALVALAGSGGLRLLGPNSMGVADLNARTLLTVNAVYTEPDPLAGHIGLISQSGSMMGGLIARARSLGIGFSRIAAVGNECDLGVPEIGAMMLEDPQTSVITLFLETLRDPDGLARFASAAHAAGKPVVAFKLGRSALGQQMAVAHTGALLSEDAVADAFLRDIGIARVRTLEGLIEAPALFAGRAPLGRDRPRVGVLTTTGGGGATVCDCLALEGVEIRPPAPATLAAVRETGLAVTAGPMLDLTLAGASAPYVSAAIAAIAADPEVDMILSVTGSSGRSSPEAATAPLIATPTGGKPLMSFITPEAGPALTRLIGAGIAASRTPEACADVMAGFCRWCRPRVTSLSRLPVAAPARVLDEAASLARLARAGVAVAPSVEIAPGDAPPLPFAYPVVAKVLSDAVPHKTEAGGVVVAIAGPDALAEAGRAIKARVEAHVPGLVVERILVAPMLVPLQEVLIGYRLDPQVGPVVTLAPGGILVGLYDDKAVRLAPVDRATARAMIAEVRGLAPLRGHRGLPPGDLDALADAIVALSGLATAPDCVLEAEANPVMVLADGAIAADALVTLAHTVADQETPS